MGNRSGTRRRSPTRPSSSRSAPPRRAAGRTDAALADALAALERREWGARAFPPTYFRRRLRRRDAVVVVLRAPDRAVAGFVIAVPDGEVPGALYVEDTLIDAPYRGRGHMRLLGEALEREALRLGYRELTRDAAIASGYADMIERAYAGRILERRDHPSEYGPQRYLRIRLSGPPPRPPRP